MSSQSSESPLSQSLESPLSQSLESPLSQSVESPSSKEITSSLEKIVPQLREDGVYIQFIISPMIDPYRTTTDCGYNIFRVIDGSVKPDYDLEPVGNRTLYRIGTRYNMFFDIDDDGSEDKDYSNEETRQIHQKLGLTQINEPLAVAQQVFNLTQEQLSLLKGVSFGPWGVAPHSEGCKSCEKKRIKCKCLCYVDSNYANDQATLYYKESEEVVWGFDNYVNNDSPVHPYVFYPMTGSKEIQWKPYYEGWIAKYNAVLDETETEDKKQKLHLF